MHFSNNIGATRTAVWLSATCQRSMNAIQRHCSCTCASCSSSCTLISLLSCQVSHLSAFDVILWYKFVFYRISWYRLILLWVSRSYSALDLGQHHVLSCMLSWPWHPEARVRHHGATDQLPSERYLSTLQNLNDTSLASLQHLWSVCAELGPSLPMDQQLCGPAQSRRLLSALALRDTTIWLVYRATNHSRHLRRWIGR